MESCSYNLRCHLQETEAVGIQLVLLHIKDHREEDVGQGSIKERLGLVANFWVLSNSFQDCFCVTHQYCQGQIKDNVLYVRLVNEFAAEEQLFLTVGLRYLSCQGCVKTKEDKYSTALGNSLSKA